MVKQVGRGHILTSDCNSNTHAHVYRHPLTRYSFPQFTLTYNLQPCTRFYLLWRVLTFPTTQACGAYTCDEFLDPFTINRMLWATFQHSQLTPECTVLIKVSMKALKYWFLLPLPHSKLSCLNVVATVGESWTLQDVLICSFISILL